MRTITVKIRKDYAMQLLEDLERSEAISFVSKQKRPIRKGRKLTGDELIERALESEKAISKKKYVTIDELQKEMKNW
ncbi:MAG TPA: hypothetical protein VNJ07_04285 [Chitinophagales bacterium]|nr:hypothetical protein [Chitinophagales bacterium]